MSRGRQLERSPLGKPAAPACPSVPLARPERPRALTVVGEARFAQTHDKVHFHLVRSHGFGANGALETWRESREKSPQRGEEEEEEKSPSHVPGSPPGYPAPSPVACMVAPAPRRARWPCAHPAWWPPAVAAWGQPPGPGCPVAAQSASQGGAHVATSCSPALKGEEQPRARSTEGLVRDLGTRPPATAPGGGCGRATSQKSPVTPWVQPDPPGSGFSPSRWLHGTAHPLSPSISNPASVLLSHFSPLTAIKGPSGSALRRFCLLPAPRRHLLTRGPSPASHQRSTLQRASKTSASSEQNPNPATGPRLGTVPGAPCPPAARLHAPTELQQRPRRGTGHRHGSAPEQFPACREGAGNLRTRLLKADQV